MTFRFEHRLAVGSLLTLLLAGPRAAAAQTAGQLGAWDGLVISPIGALAPVARDPGDLASGVNEFSLRYGRWRYDADDAVHDNLGLTWTRGLGFAEAQISLTGVYELVECPTCSGWVMGGLDLQSTLWTHSFASASARPITTGVAFRVSVGGARYLGVEATTTGSAAVAMPLDVAFPFGKTSSLCVSILPGIGFGRISGADLIESGVLPMIGAAVRWTITSRLGVDVGLQRVIITGGPTQVGAAFSLKIGSLRRAQP